MEFFAHNDIEAPIDFVFAQVTNFTSFERSIIRRGGDVERLSVGDVPVVGSKWRVKFRWRGKVRTLDAELTTVDAPNRVRADASSKNIVGAVTVELVALSRARTRISVKMDVTAKTLAAKMVFQSMRLARQRTTGRFKAMVAGFAEDVEAQYRS